MVPDSSRAVPCLLWQLCCLSLYVAVFIWIPKCFSCGLFFPTFLPPFFLLFCFLQFMPAAFRLLSAFAAVRAVLSVWDWVYWEQWSFGKREKKKLIYEGERTVQVAAFCGLCRRMKLNLHILVWPFFCLGCKSQSIISVCAFAFKLNSCSLLSLFLTLANLKSLPLITFTHLLWAAHIPPLRRDENTGLYQHLFYDILGSHLLLVWI